MEGTLGWPRRREKREVEGFSEEGRGFDPCDHTPPGGHEFGYGEGTRGRPGGGREERSESKDDEVTEGPDVGGGSKEEVEGEWEKGNNGSGNGGGKNQLEHGGASTDGEPRRR